MRKLIFSLSLLAFSATFVSAQQYDLVLEGGRVMDPETSLDAVRNVGIRDGKIVRITACLLYTSFQGKSLTESLGLESGTRNAR